MTDQLAQVLEAFVSTVKGRGTKERADKPQEPPAAKQPAARPEDEAEEVTRKGRPEDPRLKRNGLRLELRIGDVSRSASSQDRNRHLPCPSD